MSARNGAWTLLRRQWMDAVETYENKVMVPGWSGGAINDARWRVARLSVQLHRFEQGRRHAKRNGR